MTKFIAKRSTGKLELFANDFNFGRLSDCEICWIFVSDDQELSEIVNEALSGDMSSTEMLPIVKACYLRVCADRKAECEHDMLCEGAWLRAAEYDPEAFDQMIREDMMGLS